MKTPAEIWLDVNRLRASGAHPHYFGLGFIQLKVEKDQRLHFWVPHWPAIPGSATELHDHRYDFISTVLKGSVEQEVFSATPTQPEPFKGCMELVEVDCKPGREGAPEIQGYVRANLLVAHRVEAGQQYRLGNEAFHRAWSVGPTITLLERGPIAKDLARVLRPVGTPFACPFDNAITEGQCWEHIARMLETN